MNRRSRIMSRAVCVLVVLWLGWQPESHAFIGFVRVPMRAGLSLIANPLNGSPDNSANTVMPSAPDGTAIYRFDPLAQQYHDAVTFSTLSTPGWHALSGNPSDPDLLLNPGQAFWVESPEDWTNLFVGEVLFGHLVNPIPTGFSMKASIFPQAGLLQTTLGFPVQDATFIYEWTGTEYDFSAWFADLFDWFPAEPYIDVGEGFFVWAPTATIWIRDVTLPPFAPSQDFQGFAAATAPDIERISIADDQVRLQITNPDAAACDLQFSSDGTLWQVVQRGLTGSLWTGPLPAGAQGFYKLTAP